MMPMYMDSYPYQRNQVPFTQGYYPSCDGIRPNVIADQAKSPTTYESWPHGNNYGYMIPCHVCCGHGNFPGYGFRPPVSYFLPSPPLYSCGHHPMFNEPYPVHYSLPSYHPVEQRMYEYDKDAHRNYHCCGCPNHVCNQKSDKGVKIEDQEPETPRKGDSLVPVETKNYPYPIVWIPPQYMKRNNECGKPCGSEVANQEKLPSDTKTYENMESSESWPRAWNGWFPLDMNSLKSLMQGEDNQRSTQNQQNEDKMKQFSNPMIWMPSNDKKEEAEKDQRKMYGWSPLDMNGLESLLQGEEGKNRHNQQNEEKMRRFPYPIIWMPSNSEQGMAGKDRNAPPTAEQPHSTFELIPMKAPESGDSMNNSEKNKKDSTGQVKSPQVENTGNQKLVPVKEVDVHTKEDNLGSEKKVRDVKSKNAEGVKAEKRCGTSDKKESSSPPKTSKLPPVCLRVEPLTKKKNGNGSSRSPSPPGSKEQSKGNSRVSASSSSKENLLQDTLAPDDLKKKSEDVGPIGGIRLIDVVDGKMNEDRNDKYSGSQMKNSVELPIDCQADIRKNPSAQMNSDDNKSKEDEGVRCERDMMVEVASEANKAIHSAVSTNGDCGRKIKELSDVEAAALIQSAYRGFEVRKLEPLKKLKQMAQVREQMADIRERLEALEASSDLQKNNKEKDIIGEMIMRLLLKLDTIQGLHPSLRDMRKALARELVILQEKLDVLITKQLKELSEGMFTVKAAYDEVRTKDIQNKEAEIVENSYENSVHDMKMEEQDQGQVYPMVDLVCKTQCQRTLAPSSADKEVHGGCENEVRELSGVVTLVTESAPNMEVEDKNANVEHDFTEMVKEETQDFPSLEQPAELLLVPEEVSSSEELMGELPQVEVKDARADGAMKVDEDEPKDARVKGMHVEDNLQVNELRELPVKLIEEKQAVSKLENTEAVREGMDWTVNGEMDINMSTDPNSHDNRDSITTEVEVDSKIPTSKEAEIDLSAELPVGVIEEEAAVPASEKHDQIEIAKNEDLSSGEACYNVETNIITPTESDDLVSVMLEELPGNATSEAEEIQPFLSIAREERSDETVIDEKRGRGMIDVDQTPSLESAVMEAITQEPEEMKEDDQEQEANAKKEVIDEERVQGMIDVDHKTSLKSVVVDAITQEPEEMKEDDQAQEATEKKYWEVPEKKLQSEEPEHVILSDKMDGLPCESENTKEDVFVDTPSSQMSVNENGMVMERDKKLIEENARLREMMEKLMESGKEQLSVISNLTGRVKDLERKLSRKTKQRTRRYKRTPHSPPRKLFNDAITERAAEVAM